MSACIDHVFGLSRFVASLTSIETLLFLCQASTATTKLQSRYTKSTTLLVKRQTNTLPACSEAVVVNALRTLIVVVWPRHVALTLTLIDDKDDFGGDLSSQECRFIEANVFPLGEVLRWLDGFDRCRRLTMRGMRVV